MLSKVSTLLATSPVTAADIAEISALHARVFGPGRFTKTAYRVREGGSRVMLSPFCRLARKDDEIVAALRMTEATIGGCPNALLLGPLTVAPRVAGQGYGRSLITASLDAAKSAGKRFVVLVGDEPYYGRFGFKPVAPGSIVLPGPANPARILGLELEEGASADYRGLVTAI